MFNFDWPWLLLLLPLPALIYFLPAKQKTESSALRVPMIFNAEGKATTEQANKRFSLMLFSIIWCLCVIAVSRPQWLGEAVNIPTQGREMMIAVDLSGSMKIEDMVIDNQSVNRLAMVKKVLGEFIERRVGDRLGLILFADDAYMQTPMTFDRKTVKQMLDESVLGLVGQQTAIGDAITLAVKRFEEKTDSNRVLLLLTDGQNSPEKLSPIEAAELAAAKDVTIYSIGIGADEMLQRSFFGTRSINPSADLDEKTLQHVADKTGGKYFRARDTQGMAEIYQLLDELEPIDQEQQQMRPLTALFYWPLSLALLFALGFLLFQSRHLLSIKERNLG